MKFYLKPEKFINIFQDCWQYTLHSNCFLDLSNVYMQFIQKKKSNIEIQKRSTSYFQNGVFGVNLCLKKTFAKNLGLKISQITETTCLS